MKAKLLATFSEFDDCWQTLADEYQKTDLDSFVGRAKEIVPHIFSESPQVEEIEDEIQNENENYILTYDDGCGECVRIYQKL